MIPWAVSTYLYSTPTALSLLQDASAKMAASSIFADVEQLIFF
jgi:hypothetical protein